MSTQGALDPPSPTALETDILILSDGTVLAHNLTSAMAALLKELSPGDESMAMRAEMGQTLIAGKGGQDRESECSHDVPD